MRSVRSCSLFVALGCMPLWAVEARAAAPPAPAETLVDVLRQTAVILEGDVEDVSFRYDEHEGPRTVATFANIVVHLGSLGDAPPRTLELRSFGGLLPDGREVIAMHVPAFSVGARYVVFLRGTQWTLSPVTFGFVFRVAQKGAAKAVVDPFGRLVTGVGMSGPTPGPLLWHRPDGALDDASTFEREAKDVTEFDVAKALDASELAEHLRAFALATDAWPRGTFSVAPTMPSASWRLVMAPASKIDDRFASTNDGAADEEELLACFGPSKEVVDTTPLGGETCVAGGAP